MPGEPDQLPMGCRVVTSEISARILIAAQLRALDHIAWTVVSGDEPTDPAPGVEHVCIPMRREPALSDVTSAVALWRLFRTRPFAFVQTHTPKASMLALPAARLAGHRTMYTMHGSLFFRGNGRTANLAGWVFERWCCSWANLVAMQSREDTEVLPRMRVCARRKVRYQGNGIDMDRFTPVPRSTPALPVVLNISRLVTEKGCMDFFELARRLSGRARFVHVGPREVDQSDAIAPDVLDRLAAEGIVEFVGDVRDVRPYLAEAHMFVLPSYREGIPRACMEAAATGLPVVAYDIRGVREVVPSGHCLLAPRGDVDAMVALVAALLDDPQAREAAAAACCTHVRATFDERLVYERLRGLYRELRSVAR